MDNEGDSKEASIISAAPAPRSNPRPHRDQAKRFSVQVTRFHCLKSLTFMVWNAYGKCSRHAPRAVRSHPPSPHVPQENYLGENIPRNPLIRLIRDSDKRQTHHKRQRSATSESTCRQLPDCARFAVRRGKSTRNIPKCELIMYSNLQTYLHKRSNPAQ